MNPLKDLNRYLFGPISARPLGVFRIVFGVLILIYLALGVGVFALFAGYAAALRRI